MENVEWRAEIDLRMSLGRTLAITGTNLISFVKNCLYLFLVVIDNTNSITKTDNIHIVHAGYYLYFITCHVLGSACD